jgi:hypothetical protein
MGLPSDSVFACKLGGPYGSQETAAKIRYQAILVADE